MISDLNYLCIRSFLIQFVALKKIVSQIVENRSNRSRSKARNWFCFFVLVWSFSQQAGAQLKVDYGPKAGVNASFLRGDFQFPGMNKIKLGFTAGGFLNVRSTKKKNFQFEANVLFSIRGNNSEYYNTETAEFDESLAQESKSYTMGYLEFPLLCKFMFNLSPSARPYLMAGPTYAGMWFARQQIDGQGSTDVLKSIALDDFGLTVGVGFTKFYLDRWYFIDLRYYHGFTNISENLNRNLDPYNDRIKDDEFRKDIDLFTKIGNFHNSSLYLTFAVSLSKQAIFKY